MKTHWTNYAVLAALGVLIVLETLRATGITQCGKPDSPCIVFGEVTANVYPRPSTPCGTNSDPCFVIDRYRRY